MPTIIRSNGFAIRILLPPREHAPPHVHVVKDGAEVIIRLGEIGRAVRIVEIHGMKTNDVVRAVRLVELWKRQLLASWEEIHGK